VIATGGTAISTASDDPTVASIVISHGATLDVTGGTFNAKIGTGTGVNAGAAIVANGATLELGGTFVNDGSITLDGSANPTQFELDGSLTLSGGGKVILSDSADNAIVTNGSAATLTNAGNAITGAGTIGDANLTLVNSGTIDANVGLPLIIDTAAFTNAGTLEATSAGGLVIDSNVNNSKTIEALGTSATVTSASTISNTATALVLASRPATRRRRSPGAICSKSLRRIPAK
jgi:large repetitive protein